MKKLLFRTSFILVIAFLFISLNATTVFAGTRAAINLAGFWSGQFDTAVGAIGDGGGVNIMACPADIPLLNEVIQKANYPKINLWLRGHWPGQELTPTLAEEWGLALRALDTRYKVFFFPVNEPNGAQENGLRCSPGVPGCASVESVPLNPTAVKSFTDALFASMGGLVGSKVEIISPTIDPFASYDQNHVYIKALGRSYFDRFFGVSISMYGQYDSGTSTSPTGAKNGDFLSEPAFVNLMGAGSNRVFIESGVLCNQNPASVTYGQDNCHGRIADDVIADFFTLRSSGPWNNARVYGPSILSYNPDPKNFSGGDIGDDQFGWIFDSKSLGVMTSRYNSPEIPPVPYGGGADLNALAELKQKIAAGNLQDCVVDESPIFVEKGEYNVAVQLTFIENLIIAFGQLINHDFTADLSSIVPVGNANLPNFDYEKTVIEGTVPALLPSKYQIVKNKGGNAKSGKTTIRFDSSPSVVSMKASIYAGGVSGSDVQEVVEQPSGSIDGKTTVKPATNLQWVKPLKSNNNVMNSVAGPGKIEKNKGNEISFVSPPKILAPGKVAPLENNGEDIKRKATNPQGEISFGGDPNSPGTTVLRWVVNLFKPPPSSSDSENPPKQGKPDAQYGAKLHTEQLTDGFTFDEDKQTGIEFINAGLPRVLQPDYNKNSQLPNTYTGPGSVDKIEIVHGKAKGYQQGYTSRFCATLPKGTIQWNLLCSDGNLGSNQVGESTGKFPIGVNIAQSCTISDENIERIIGRYSAFIGSLGEAHIRNLASVINRVAQEKKVNAILLASLWGEESYFSKIGNTWGLGCVITPTLENPNDAEAVKAHVEAQAQCIGNTINTTINESKKTEPQDLFEAFICRWATGQFACDYNERIARIVEGTARSPGQTETRPGVLDMYDAFATSCGKL